MKSTIIAEKFRVYALVLISLQALSFSALASPSKIVVRPTIVVANPRVDASCLLEDSAPSTLKEALTKITVGVIANPLGELLLRREEIVSKLGDLAGSLELPRRIQILRNGDILSMKDISSKIIEISGERIPSGRKVEIDRSRLPPHVVLPGKVKSWTIKPMSSNPLGMNLFTLEADCDGGVHRQILQTNVWMEMKAAKIKRLINRGETLDQNNIEMEMVKVKNLSQQNFLPFEEAIGKKLNVYKSPGSLLRSGETSEYTHAVEITDLRKYDRVSAGERFGKPSPAKSTVRLYNIKNSGLENSASNVSPKSPKCAKEDWIVKPGQQVLFHVKTGSLSLSVPAKAIDGGCVGDPIKLVNLQNHRNIDGVIVGEGQVEYVQK